MRILRALSLDVVAGAACGGLLAEHISGAEMKPSWWIALLSAVWCVYTVDHLCDALRGRPALVTARHLLHLRHSRILTASLLSCLLLGLLAACVLASPIRLTGIGLSLAVIMYLASAQRLVFPNLPKEPVAGIIYAAGIWSGPLLTSAGPIGWGLVAASLHALAAILNLVALGVFETDVDRVQGSRSLALRFGPTIARRWVLRASACGMVIALMFAGIAPPLNRDGFTILAAQVGMPAVMLLAAAWFSRRERYRVWGDSVFLLGALPRLLT